jgi:hypothetical protein
MSIKTWIEEFYPITAQEAPRNGLVAHSLMKWQGALASNLEKHGVFRNGDGDCVLEDADGEEFLFGTKTCSLCEEYFNDCCTGCPLLLVRDGKRCYEPRGKEVGPYRLWCDTGDARPMIELLTAAKKYDTPHESHEHVDG